MLPTTVRARRDPRWPKAWEKDWDGYEASASQMLRVQDIPLKFQNSKIMEGVIGEEYDKNIRHPKKLIMNFEIEQVSDSRRSQEIGSCLACGNCLAGCPYNAKNSTDRTYLVSAIQAGCTIITECEVQYVVRNKDDTCKEDGKLQRSCQRRWRVFLNEFDYITSDIVILSAEVFGTAKILFQSQLRGLPVSGKLGSRYCQLKTAVIPTAYPSFLFKGITTYGWQSGYFSLYGIIDKLKYVLGLKRGQEMVLNAIGHDDSSGKLTFEKDTNRIFFQPPRDHLLPQKIEAFQKLAKKLGGVLFMSRFRSTLVHLLGGCIASPDVSSGVCNPDGQVFDTTSPTGVHSGLYICDASIIPCSIGINPCLTIAAAAEHVSRHLVQDAIEYIGNFANKNSDKRPGSIYNGKMKKSSDSEVMTKETMRGQVGGMPCTAYLKLRFKSPGVTDKTNNATGKSNPLLRGKVGGYIECKALEIDKMYVIHGEVDLCKTDVRTPYTQYMHYHLLVAASSGSRYVLEGKKIMNPYLLALYVLKGKLHISPLELLKSICALEGGSRSTFVCLLMQSLLRTYILQAPRGRLINFTPMELAREPYPDKDNFTISCQHWECSHSAGQLEQEKKPYLILLINGYATESYFLPTEKNDLVRTLLKDGHDIWLLHARVHWSNSSNHFSVEDIDRIDIPAEQLWVLDSVPGKVIQENSDGEVEKVLQTLQNLPSKIPSRKWLVDHMLKLGFSKSLSEWIGSNLKKSGEQETWAFNLDGAVQMFNSYRWDNILNDFLFT